MVKKLSSIIISVAFIVLLFVPIYYLDVVEVHAAYIRITEIVRMIPIGLSGNIWIIIVIILIIISNVIYYFFEQKSVLLGIFELLVQATFEFSIFYHYYDVKTRLQEHELLTLTIIPVLFILLTITNFAIKYLIKISTNNHKIKQDLSIEEKLGKLQELLEKGLISETDFEKQKNNVLSKL